jgi:stage II sporulation protein D
MKKSALRSLLAGVVFLAGCLQSPGAVANAQVSISVFSRLHPRSVSIMAAKGMIICTVGTEKNICPDVRIAWQSPQRLQCRWPEAKAAGSQRLLIQPEIPGVALRIKVPDFPAREFRGSFAVSARDSALLLLNTLALEDYLYGVIGAEMAAGGEAQKCQALVSRTYALGNTGRHRNRGYDFCDTTHCQYYRGLSGENPEIRAAIDQTRGMALFFKGKLAKVFCHSTCGGVTTAVDTTWGGRAIPYLQPVDDGGACRFSPHFRWQAQVGAAELLRILSIASRLQVSGFQIEKTASAGWVQTLVLNCAGGGERLVSGEWFHLALGRQLGWNTFKSGNFTIERSGDHWLFSGRGLGHGVGLCQFGTMQLARQGMDFRQIARFYFPGTEIRLISNW